MPETYTGDEGDEALAGGLDVMDGTEDRRDGWLAINKTRDMIAQLKTWVTAQISSISLTWSSISGKPSTFPPSTHSHAKTDVTGLQADLNYLGGEAVKIGPLQSGGFNSDVWNRDITWTRRTGWIGNSGGSITLGYASSQEVKKQDFAEPEWTAEQLRAIPIMLYRYRAEIAKQLEDPDYHVSWNLGTTADALHELGLWEFVVYEGHGEDAVPVGVHYEILSLAALWLAQRNSDRLDALEAG